MKSLPMLISILVAATVVVPVALAAEEPTRDAYVAQVEPICQTNTVANKRALKNVSDKVQQGKLYAAAHQFFHASEQFGAAVKEIVAVPRPAADDSRLTKWFGVLKIVKTNLRNIGKALLAGDKVKAIHERIRLERSANAANNVGYVFNFHYCRLTPSRFR